MVFFTLGLLSAESETSYPGYLANNSNYTIIMRVYKAIEPGTKAIGSAPIYSIPLEKGETYKINLPLGEYMVSVYNVQLKVWNAQNFKFKKEQTGADFVLQYMIK